MYYFIGIKGSGMASLATILYDLGHKVAGSDIDKYIFIEDELKKRDIPIYSFNKNNIKDGYDVIIGNAFDESNEEVKEALANPNVKTHTYYDFLAQLLDKYVSIGIAGTHGKTTTTGMAYHLFKDYNKTSVLIGDGTGHAVKDTVVVWGDDPHLPHLNYTKRVLKFGISDKNDVIAKNIINNNHGLYFDVYIHGDLFGHFALPFYGMHMLYDSLAVITLGYLENMDADYIQKRLSTFDGVKRRYTVQEVGNNVYVDDYAHHPTAIKYVIEATRSRYPGKEIVAIFQPDRFSRGLRFAKEFAESMNLADYPFLVHFPENAKKEAGIDIDIHEIGQYLPRAIVIHEDEDAVKLLAEHDDVVFLFMSSKDIYKFEDMLIDYKSTH